MRANAKSASLAMLLRYGRAAAPAGMISSVDTSSPHFDHHRGGQGVPVLVVAAREELEIAAQVRATVEAST